MKVKKIAIGLILNWNMFKKKIKGVKCDIRWKLDNNKKTFSWKIEFSKFVIHCNADSEVVDWIQRSDNKFSSSFKFGFLHICSDCEN